MSVKLYMDEQVQGQITRALRARGVDVITVQEDGRDGAEDPDVLDRAGALGRVVFTRDDDFLREATRRQRAAESFGGVVYAYQLGPSIADCIRDLELIAVAGEPDEFEDRVQYLPL